MDYNKIIIDIFSNNNEDLIYVDKAEDNFNYLYYYNYLSYRSKNKLELLIKTIATRTNSTIYYSFTDEGYLQIKVSKKVNEKLYFENYLGWIPLNQDYIMLGIDSKDQPIYEKIQNVKSLLIGGSSGSGKSNLLHQILLSYLFLNNNNYLYIIDMKANEFTRYNSIKNRLVVPVAYEFESALKIIVNFRNTIARRFKSMMKKGQRFSEEPPVLLVIDEYAQLFQTPKQKRVINDLISQCASLGRAANCYLILATQHPTNENINNTIRANMQSRIVLKCMNPQQSHNLLGTSEATKLVNPGDSIIHIDGKMPIVAKTSYISDKVLEQALIYKTIDC